MCFMMWKLALILFSCVHVHVMSHETKVECHEFDVTEFHPSNGTSPSVLADFEVAHVTEGGKDMLNISWAVNIDVSVEYLTGTQILTGEASYICEYNPHLSKADKTGAPQLWFHYLIRGSPGTYLIQATNLPLPPLGSDSSYKRKLIRIPYPTKSSVALQSSHISTATAVTPGRSTASSLRIGHVAVAMVGGMICLMILTFCYIIYKYRNRIAKPFGFQILPQTLVVPVPVLVVYPAENAAFQQAVVALTEFLQWHGGCQVAIDMWQQGKIAALGPMRWLAEQAKAADRVLIICPQHSQQPSHSPPDGSFPQPSIPAAAHDLYPLTLNMVASHAKSPSDLAKFWVVQLGKQQDKRLCSDLAVELRACRSFCLMKDLNKLCRSLHTQRQGNKKMSYLSSRAQVSYSEKSTVKLQEAVEKIFRHMEPLRNVVTSV
nr:PREDICTED: LOW QUALITY PROTEIN: interleukin-17 receptor B [Paralichthys olivaceus]